MDEASQPSRATRDTLRRSLKARRSQLPAETVRAASRLACDRISQHAAFRRARRVALYAATRGEIDVTALADAVWARRGEVVFPRVDSASPPRLTFHRVEALHELANGSFEVREPHGASPTLAPGELDLFIVPGVAFDRAGHRLGFGGGYYDAALSAAPRAYRIGVCHAFQLVESFSHRDDDQPVDVVITPDETLEVEGSRAGREDLSGP